MRRLVPDLVGEVTDVVFEHSPGRGHPRFTADHTAFDVLLRCTTPQGRSAFVALELKYTEAPPASLHPLDPVMTLCHGKPRSFAIPTHPHSATRQSEQLWREQLLVTAMLQTGDYDAGRLLVIAPQPNTECQTTITRYRTELISDDPAETRFQAITLEDITTAIGCAGAHTTAGRLIIRYLNLEPVHRALAETFRPAQPVA